MQFTIYSIGDSLFLEQVLIALAMISGVPDFVMMIKIGLAIGVFSVIVSAIMEGGREIKFQPVIVGLLIYLTMFVPTATVVIEDTYSGALRPVANVPIGAAAAGGIISLIGYKATEMFELAYGPVMPRITETQFSESLSILNSMRKKAADPAIWSGINADAGGGYIDVRRSYSNYMKDCTLKKIDLGIMKIDDLYNKNYLTSLEFNSHTFRTHVYLQTGNASGQNKTCADAWTALTAISFSGAETEDALKATLGFDANKLAAGETAFGKATTAIDSLLGSAVTANTYLAMAVLEPVIAQAAANKYNDFNDFAGATMINQSLNQRNTEWAAEQTLFMTIVRPMLAFFEAFIYAIFPIMAFVIVLGAKGIQLAGKYFTMIIWIQLWMPLLAIVNLYIHTAAIASFQTYTAVATHNWNSFYALDTASDIAQHWIATGGLLAASTPALALMLIYGSAVTATHLAGRLKGSDHINEKIPTPDIVSSKPMHDIASQYSGNMTSGLTQSGTEALFSSMTVGAKTSSAIQSGSTVANARNQQLTESLNNTFASSTTTGEQYAALQSMGAATSAGSSSVSQYANTRAMELADTHQELKGHEEAVAGQIGLQASASLQSSKNSGLAALADNIGMPVPKLKAMLQGSMASSTKDSSTESSGNSSKSSTGFVFTAQEQANYNNELSAGLVKQQGDTHGKNWNDTQSNSIQTAATALFSANEEYKQTSGFESTFSKTAAMPLNMIGGLMAGNNQADMKGDTSVGSRLNDAWKFQSDKVQEDAGSKQQLYQNLGMPEDVAMHTARLDALTSPANYTDDKGNIDHQAMQNGTQLAGSIIQQATGHGTAGDHDAWQNKDLKKPDVNTEAMAEKADNMQPVDNNGQENIKNNALNQTPPDSNDIAGSGAVEQRSQENQAQLIQNSRNAEAGTKAEALQNAEEEIKNNYTSQGMAAQTIGAITNAMDWSARTAEKYSGAASSYMGKVEEGDKQAYNAYRNMSEEDQAQFRQAQQSQDAALFDSLPAIAALPIKGAQMVGNTILGALISAGDATRNNGDLSEIAKGMSYEERGAFYTTALAESVAIGGPQAAQQFMETHGTEFAQAQRDYAFHELGLKGEGQAEVYAASFDTTPAKMKAAINQLEAPYATTDEHGNPQWDDANNRWELTPERRELTTAIADSIYDSTDAGGKAGSYLAPIAAYNIINDPITPERER